MTLNAVVQVSRLLLQSEESLVLTELASDQNVHVCVDVARTVVCGMKGKFHTISNNDKYQKLSVFLQNHITAPASSDGWMDRWTDGGLVGWMDGRMEAERTDECTNARLAGRRSKGAKREGRKSGREQGKKVMTQADSEGPKMEGSEGGKMQKMKKGRNNQ